LPILNRKSQTRTIQPYFKTIQDNILPLLSNYGISMSTTPINSTMTQVSYSGNTYNNDRVIIDFLSNSSKIEDNDSLFCNVHYNSGANSAGIINLKELDDSILQIVHALNELGYKTPEENQEAIEKAEKEKANKKGDWKTRYKDKEDFLKKNIIPDEPNDSKNDGESYKQDQELSVKESKDKFDKYLKVMTKNNMADSRMFITILVPTGSVRKALSIDLIYVDSENCNIKTEGISPKIDKQTTWTKAKNYIFKVTESVNGTISIEASDVNGKSIDIKDTVVNNVEDDIDLGFEV
jgi:hypothetical protein